MGHNLRLSLLALTAQGWSLRAPPAGQSALLIGYPLSGTTRCSVTLVFSLLQMESQTLFQRDLVLLLVNGILKPRFSCKTSHGYCGSRLLEPLSRQS